MITSKQISVIILVHQSILYCIPQYKTLNNESDSVIVLNYLGHVHNSPIPSYFILLNSNPCYSISEFVQ